MIASQFLCNTLKVTVHNDCIPQFNLFQIQTTTYKLLRNDLSQIRISSQGKENFKKFSIFSYFWEFSL